MSGKDEDWGLDGAPAVVSVRLGRGGCGLHECESESENDGEQGAQTMKSGD